MSCGKHQDRKRLTSASIGRQAGRIAKTVGVVCLLTLASGCAFNRALIFRSAQETPGASAGVSAGAAASVPANCAAPNGTNAQPMTQWPQNGTQQQPSQPASTVPNSVPPDNSANNGMQSQPSAVQQPSGQQNGDQQSQATTGPVSSQMQGNAQGMAVNTNQQFVSDQTQGTNPMVSQQSMQTNPSQSQACAQPTPLNSIPAAPILAAELNQCQKQMAEITEELGSVKRRSDSTLMALEAMAAGQNRMYEENQRLREAVAESDRRLREELEATDRNLEEFTQIVDDVLSTATATPRQAPPAAERPRKVAPEPPSIPLPSVDGPL